MEISIWESCLIKKVRSIQNDEIRYVPDKAFGIISLFEEVDQDVLKLSKVTVEEVEEVEEESNEEQIPQPIVYGISWDLFKENKYEVYLLPKTNRSEEIRLRTKVSLLAVRKGYVIKIVDKLVNNMSLIIEVDKVTECSNGDIRINGLHLNKLPNGE